MRIEAQNEKKNWETATKVSDDLYLNEVQETRRILVRSYRNGSYGTSMYMCIGSSEALKNPLTLVYGKTGVDGNSSYYYTIGDIEAPGQRDYNIYGKTIPRETFLSLIDSDYIRIPLTSSLFTNYIELSNLPSIGQGSVEVTTSYHFEDGFDFRQWGYNPVLGGWYVIGNSAISNYESWVNTVGITDSSNGSGISITLNSTQV